MKSDSVRTRFNPTKLHAGGQRALYQARKTRFLVVACGRRWGKTHFGKVMTYEALLKRKTDVWWVSPTYKMSSAMWRVFRRDLGAFATAIDTQERTMEFDNGAALTVWTGESADTMRGGAPGLVIVDEAAMIRDADMWPAVIRPALTDHSGSAIFLSTPRGRNWFWELYNRGLDPAFPQYKSWNFPTSANPLLKPEEIEEARQTLPDRLFRQEYLAEFLDDAGGVFRGVAEVSRLDPLRAPKPGARYVGGIDWGRAGDFTVFTLLDADTHEQVYIDRFQKIGWEVQRGRIRAACDKWRPTLIEAEANSIGEPNIEALRREGLPVRAFQTTSSSKGPLIDDLALAIERGDLALLNDRVQVAELQAYELERLPSGSYRYSAPDGGHDDTVIALALAWHGLRHNHAARVESNPLYG